MSTKHVFRALLAVGILALGGVASAQQVEEGKTRFVPWSGYWWPHYEGRMISGPLAKYDQYSGRNAADREAQAHPRAGAAKWHGYCHAWSAAAVVEKEPNNPFAVTPLRGGSQIVLGVDDQKGLLTIAHARDVANVYGRRYYGNPGDDRADIYPDVLWKYLKHYIKNQGIPLIIDTEAGTEVWNYPVYAYRIEYSPVASGSGDYTGKMTLSLAEDSVPPNFVGTKTAQRSYTFSFKMRSGNVVAGSGKWTGASVREHPDFAWYPHVTRPENPQVDYALVRRMLNMPASRGDEAPIPANPIADPANPPAPQPQPPQPPPPPQPGNPSLEVVRVPPAQPLPGTPSGTPVAPSVTLSPTEMLTAMTQRPNPTSFGFVFNLNRFNDIWAPGEPFSIQGNAAKAGYAYFFLVDNEGNMKLLYPNPTDAKQDNRIPANAKFEIGGPNDKSVKFATPDKGGLYHVRGLITVAPLNFTGLNLGPPQQPKQQAGQALEFHLNPTQKEQIKDQVVKVQTKALLPEKVQEFTGVNLPKVLPAYAISEAAFVVDEKKPREKPKTQP